MINLSSKIFLVALIYHILYFYLYNIIFFYKKTKDIKSNMQYTTLQIDKKLHRQLKLFAKKNNLILKLFVENIIKRAIEKDVRRPY